MPALHETNVYGSEPTATAAQLDGTRFLVLAGVCAYERHGDGSRPCGRDVVGVLEAQFGIDLGRGVYPHLDALAQAGLVEKAPAPGAANSYRSTESGADVVRGAAEWLEWVVGGA